MQRKPELALFFNEAMRVSTFVGWPHEFPTIKDMAEAGFFLLGYQDQTQCAFCSVIINQWEPLDQPMMEHKRHAPYCSFVNKINIGDLPVNSTAVQYAITSSAGVSSQLSNTYNRGTPARYVHKICSTARPEQATKDEEDESSVRSILELLSDVHIHERAKCPTMSTLESRLKTFRDWPQDLTPSPYVLAEAGFFYTCTADRVTCFCCLGYLANLEPTDNPWEEHARRFPSCTFLVASKGTEYVREINQKYMETKSNVKEIHAESGTIEEQTHTSVVTEPVDKCGTSDGDLQNALTCKIFYNEPFSIVFVPCGHAMTCSSCAAILLSCPFCRKRINGIVKAFFSFS